MSLLHTIPLYIGIYLNGSFHPDEIQTALSTLMIPISRFIDYLSCIFRNFSLQTISCVVWLVRSMIFNKKKQQQQKILYWPLQSLHSNFFFRKNYQVTKFSDKIDDIFNAKNRLITFFLTKSPMLQNSIISKIELTFSRFKLVWIINFLKKKNVLKPIALLYAENASIVNFLIDLPNLFRVLTIADHWLICWLLILYYNIIL